MPGEEPTSRPQSGPGTPPGWACWRRATGITFALTKNRLTADFSAAMELIGIVNEATTEG